MIFVFPMAGESRRFARAGYPRPKFELMMRGAPLFDHVVGGFSAYFGDDEFLFITKDAAGAAFAERRCKTLGVENAKIVNLATGTSGQAQTVMAGLEKAAVADEDALIVFNIDTVRPDYAKPHHVDDPSFAGYLEVFHGSGSNWSRIAENSQAPGTVAAVVEKMPISDLCCTGLYHFRNAGDFRWAYRHPAQPLSEAERQERYVAPLYNALIARGERIAFAAIAPSQVVFCGTPEEYENAAASEEIRRQLRP